MIEKRILDLINQDHALLESMLRGDNYGANHCNLPINYRHFESIILRLFDYVDTIPSDSFSIEEYKRICDIKRAMRIDMMCQKKEPVIKQLMAYVDEVISILRSKTD